MILEEKNSSLLNNEDKRTVSSGMSTNVEVVDYFFNKNDATTNRIAYETDTKLSQNTDLTTVNTEIIKNVSSTNETNQNSKK